MDAGNGLKAEGAFRRVIALLKDGPQNRLVVEMEQLVVLQVATGEMRQAERNEQKALEIRQTLEDPVGVALTESAIAGVCAVERKFTRMNSGYLVLAASHLCLLKLVGGQLRAQCLRQSGELEVLPAHRLSDRA